MNAAQAYLVQFAEDKPSEFFKHTPNEVVFTRFDDQKNELYITNFLGRGDMVNNNNVCIANESIPKYENRWIGALHVILESGKHLPYYKPKNIAMSAMEEELFFKAQAIPHSIGKYVDSFHITDEIGIHNLYGTLLTQNPLAIQKYIEKKYPRYTSSSLMVNAKDSKNRITDWTPIDNTSVHKPAYGMTLAEIVDSCSCVAGNKGGSSCITKLRTSANEKQKMLVTVAQSSMDHAIECIEKGFEYNKNYFSSDNAHYQFLAQSSIMSANEGSAGAAATGAKGTEGNASGDSGQQNNTQNNNQNQNQNQNLGAVLLNRTDRPNSAKEMSNINFEGQEGGEGEGQGKGDQKPEGQGEGKPEGDKTQDNIDWKARALAAEATNKEIDKKVKGFDEMKAKFDARERLDLITDKINKLGKGKLSEERREQLVKHYNTEFKSVADLKELDRLIDKEFEMFITPTVKQSGLVGSEKEITERFLAKSGETEEKKKPNNRFIDVTKLGEYIP